MSGEFILQHLGAFMQVVHFIDEESEEVDLLTQFIGIVFREPGWPAANQATQCGELWCIVSAQTATGDP